MKCNIKKQKTKAPALASIDSKHISIPTTPKNIDLNKYYYHGIGTYLEPYQKLNRLRSILDSKAILSENNQPNTFYLSNALSQSPKCNGEDHISICQKESFLDQAQDSESFKLFVANGISIILAQDISSSLDVENHFTPTDVWEWLDGEYRVKDEIPSEHFIGIGIPSRSLEEVALSYKRLRHYTLSDSISHILDSDWYKDMTAIQSYMDYNDIDLPLYSIVSGQQMGNIYSAFATVYGVPPSEVERVCHNLSTPTNQRIGTIRSLLSQSILSDYEDPFCK